MAITLTIEYDGMRSDRIFNCGADAAAWLYLGGVGSHVVNIDGPAEDRMSYLKHILWINGVDPDRLGLQSLLDQQVASWAEQNDKYQQAKDERFNIGRNCVRISTSDRCLKPARPGSQWCSDECEAKDAEIEHRTRFCEG